MVERVLVVRTNEVLGAFNLAKKCWGIMLAGNLRVRLHEIMVKADLEKLPVHGLVHGR